MIIIKYNYISIACGILTQFDNKIIFTILAPPWCLMVHDETENQKNGVTHLSG